MKRKEKAVISLDQHEMMELERIVIDGDQKEALSFLKKVIKKKVDQSSVGMGCGPAV